MKIPFNVPCFTGREIEFIQDSVQSKHISGNGSYTKKCHTFFEQTLGFHKVLLTHSCTAALEMSALLAELQEGDEVLLPSFTHPSTANAFARTQASLVFVDSEQDYPNIDVKQLQSLISPRTKVIVPMHYAGLACEMDQIMALAKEHNLLVVEDAAHGIGGTYKGNKLGSIGHLSAFSFHETKNITSGQGGMLVLNEDRFVEEAQCIWENGTNRAAFFQGKVDRYTWVSVGSCFLPSELSAAYLYAQLIELHSILDRRKANWQRYYERLQELETKGYLTLPPQKANRQHSAHIFFVMAHTPAERTKLLDYLNQQGIGAVFHYIPLHSSPFYREQHQGHSMENSQKHSDCIIRLPLFDSIEAKTIDFICDSLHRFFQT